MKKILQFDKYGKYVRTFDSYDDVMAAFKNQWNNFDFEKRPIYLKRVLFRECKSCFGNVFAFEDDERISYKNGKPAYLDVIEEITVKDNKEYIKYKEPKLKYDTVKLNANKVMVVRDYKYISKKQIILDALFFDSIDHARNATGAKQIWGCLLGENKASNGYVFKFVSNDLYEEMLAWQELLRRELKERQKC